MMGSEDRDEEEFSLGEVAAYVALYESACISINQGVGAVIEGIVHHAVKPESMVFHGFEGEEGVIDGSEAAVGDYGYR